MNPLVWKERQVAANQPPKGVQAGDELGRLGTLFAYLFETPAYTELVRMIDQEKIDVALRGHFDREAPAGYYEGLLVGMDRFRDIVEETVTKALQQEQEAATVAPVLAGADQPLERVDLDVLFAVAEHE